MLFDVASWDSLTLTLKKIYYNWVCKNGWYKYLDMKCSFQFWYSFCKPVFYTLPLHQKTAWLGIFYMCIPTGYAIGYVYGGLVSIVFLSFLFLFLFFIITNVLLSNIQGENLAFLKYLVVIFFNFIIVHNMLCWHHWFLFPFQNACPLFVGEITIIFLLS